MNDINITNTISKIHFIIVSALLFIFLTLSILFILLQNGIYVKDFSLPNVHISKLYIKWNKKLNISIQDIKIIKDSKEKKPKIDFADANKLFKALPLFDNWFQRIEINKIRFNDIEASFKYLDGEDGFLNAESKDFSLKSSLFFESGFFNAKIDELKDLKRNININGNIIFNAHGESELISSLDVDINKDIQLKVHTLINKKQFLYKIDSKKSIKNITHTIKMLDMPKEVQYWVYDAIKMSEIEIKYAYGWLDFDNIKGALNNLHVWADVHNLEYTYNPALKPVLSKVTELEFKDSTLFIRPKKAYQYGFYLNKSWLKIDFSKKEELLTLQLLFNAKVNKDLLNLLNTYKIKLPLLQNSGSVDTDLKITVGLRNIDVKAKGNFYTKKANFRYLGLDIDIFDARIFLNNYDVTIKKMHSKYLDIATANVDVDFNANTQEGSIDFDVLDVKFKDIGLKLKKTKTPLKILYTVSNKQDTIDVKKSKWIYKNKEVVLDRIVLPFNLDTLTAKIPTTYVKVGILASAYVSGTFSLNPIRTNLDVDLLSFALADIKMEQSNASLKVQYDKKIIIKTKENIRFDANSLNYQIKNAQIEINDKNLNIIEASLKVGEFAKTNLDAKFNFKNENGVINLKNLRFKNKDLGEIFSSKENIKLDLLSNKKKTKIISKKFDMNFTLKEKRWKLKFNSIDNLATKSKLLQDYNITNGSFALYKKITQKNIQFYAKTNYSYKLLVLNNKPIQNYKVKGYIDNKTNNINLNINKALDVVIDKDIQIKANKIGININEVLQYFGDRESSSKEGKNVIFSAQNSYVYISENRHAIADDIELQYFNNVVTAQLRHKNAHAGFELKDKKFYLFGENFNDKFMENLFSMSKFKDGTLSFSMAGSTQEYDGLLHVKETTILDYKILNNILAFVNTIPSLITFSLPGYSKKGLEVKNAYMNFHSKNNIINIENISLNSKEMNIVGKGNASFENDTIDLNLNLKTDLGSDVAKIPVVGYILLDGDTISTSMNISGKLSDPDIKSLIAQDIVVAPLNILWRTLTLPFHLFNSKDDNKSN